MAIPHWTEPSARPVPDDDRLDEVSATFGALSDPTRLAILAAVARRQGPVPYSELQAATGVEDNGRLNYHVRRLRGEFLDRERRGYVLTERGVAAADLLADV